MSSVDEVLVPYLLRLSGSDSLGIMAGTGHEVEFASRQALEWLDRDQDDLPFDWVSITPLRHRTNDDEMIRIAQRDGSTRWFAKEFERADGSTIAVDVLALAVGNEPFTWLALVRPSEERSAALDLDRQPAAIALLRLARALTGVGTVDEVFEIVDRLGAVALDADQVRVALVDDEANDLVVHHDPSADDEARTIWARVAIDECTVLGRAAATRTTVTCDIDEVARLFPDIHEEVSSRGVRRLAAAPMLDDRSGLIGVLGVSWLDDTHVQPEQVERVAELVADALSLALSMDFERVVASTLQELLLPATLERRGVPIAVRHKSFDVSVGGDFYDAIAGDGFVWLVVGDCVGHGLAASRTMAKVRFFIRAIAREVSGPGELLRRVDALLHAEDQRELVTCVVAQWWLDRDDGDRRGVGRHDVDRSDVGRPDVVIASAGHPAPVAVDAGVATIVDTTVGPPLGALPDVEAWPESVIRRPDRLLLFTDGVVERRDEPIDVCLGRFVDVVTASAGLELEAMADWIMANAVGDDQGDDQALVCAADPSVVVPLDPDDAGDAAVVIDVG